MSIVANVSLSLSCVAHGPPEPVRVIWLQDGVPLNSLSDPVALSPSRLNLTGIFCHSLTSALIAKNRLIDIDPYNLKWVQRMTQSSSGVYNVGTLLIAVGWLGDDIQCYCMLCLTHNEQSNFSCYWLIIGKLDIFPPFPISCIESLSLSL